MLAKPNMLAEALAYAKRGWPVFPCNPTKDPEKSKAPLVGRDKDAEGKPVPNTGGVKKATTDERQIREWWGKWPAALIGIPTGKAIGLWVLDFDPEDETVEMIEARVELAVGKLPLGPRSRTQSGGWHIWFKLPAGEIPKNSAKRLANVDWRAEGGYVIAPPSRMADGATYEWLVSPDVSDFPDAPPGLLDLVFRRGRFSPALKPRSVGEYRALVDDKHVRRYCEVALSRAAGRVRALVKGQRNSEFNNIALGIGHLVGAGGIGRSEAYAALREAALAWGIGDDDKALKAGGTLDRALDDGAREPADLTHVGRREERDPERDKALMDAFGGGMPPAEAVPHDEVTGEIFDDAPPPDGGGGEGGHEDEGEAYAEDKPPYRCLGFQRGVYYYFSDKTQQITPLRAKDHTTLNLMQLADLNYWQRRLDTRQKITAEQWQLIANGLMEGCHRAGIFIETNVRGRGAWTDGKTVIVHTGDSARISGEIVPLNDIPGRFIYEAEPPWNFQFGAPATNKDAHALADICARLTWVDPMSGALLCGWCVIAPVCGALKWRPHVWITGPSQSGKTTAVEEIVVRIVGPSAERFEGNTTEPGIRQKMGFDARPIILDEAESEDAAAVLRMQAILGLARIASSGGTISKGSQSGRAMSFVARSCFCFSSINTSLRHHADESRVSKLVLARNNAPDALAHYQGLMRDISARFTPQYAGAMFSRTIRYLPELLDNIETFKVAASLKFRNRRAADQIGPMLAGYYLCHRPDRISLADAEAFISKHDWTDHVALESTTDEARLFTYLMSRRIRVQLGGHAHEVSIGQAIESTADDHEGKAYIEALGPIGIKVGYEDIAISNSADRIRELLRETPWSSDWKRPLSMIDGASKSENAVYFAPGLITRAVILPLSLLRGE